MADELNLNTAMNAVNLFMSSVKTCRFYPESSEIVKKSLSTGYNRLTSVFYRPVPFVVSEAEGSILFDGKALDPKSQRMPLIVSLRSLMESLNLKSISFAPGIDIESYGRISRILSLPPEEVEALGGIREIVATEGINYVSVNHKTFVASDSDKVIESDEELFRNIWFDQIVEPQAMGYIAKQIRRRAWLKSVHKRFVTYIFDKGAEANDWESVTSLARLSGLLIKTGIEGEDREIFQVVYNCLEQLGPWFNCDTLALNLSDTVVTGALEQLTDDSFMLLSARLLLMHRSHRRGSRLVGAAHIRPYVAASDWVLSLPRGIQYKYQIDELRKQQERVQKKELVRIEVLIEGLLDGNTQALDDFDALASLPRVITERVNQGRGDEAEKLIQAISMAINLDAPESSMAAVRVLLHTARAFIGQDRREMVIRVVRPVNLWVRYQQEVTPLFEAVSDMLVNHVHNLVVAGQCAEAIPVVESFSLVEQGRLKKNAKLTEYAGKTMRRIASERVFNTIMKEFRTNEKGDRQYAANFLVQLGRNSVPPLLDLLRISDDMAERIRTMGVLQAIGPAALDETLDRIKPDSAWFYLRNLLKVLGEIGGEEHVDILEPLLGREEEQVLDATISCVKQIGGGKRSRFFSKAILKVPNTIKPRLAGLLGQLDGDEAVYALSNVLKLRLMGPPEERDIVIQSVCRALGEIGSIKALPALQQVVDQKGILGRSRFTADQKNLAEEMILMIREAVSKARTSEVRSEPVTRGKMTREYIAHEDFGALETFVSGLVTSDKKPSALKMLLLMVERAAREKDFDRAERYKTQISDVDELALGEVVRAEEIIEQEKRLLGTGEYMETWKALYAVLSEEEASSFYDHIKSEVVDVDAEIISQGEVIDRLYFINSGRLKIIYKDGPKEIFIKEMGKGEVAGYDAFFQTNLSTASLVALSRVNVGYLDLESLKVLGGKYPDFVEKLRIFCGRFDNLSETVQAKGVERRRYKRFEVEGKAVFQLLTNKGASVGKAFSGVLIDISEGGLSAEVKSSGYSMARLLLGRPICCRMTSGKEADPFSVNGRVSSVNARGANAISIHIAFGQPMDVSVLETLLTSN